MSEGRLLKIPEVAACLSISRSGVYRLMERGELRSVRIGRGVRFPPAEIERLMNGRKEEPGHAEAA